MHKGRRWLLHPEGAGRTAWAGWQCRVPLLTNVHILLETLADFVARSRREPTLLLGHVALGTKDSAKRVRIQKPALRTKTKGPRQPH